MQEVDREGEVPSESEEEEQTEDKGQGRKNRVAQYRESITHRPRPGRTGRALTSTRPRWYRESNTPSLTFLYASPLNPHDAPPILASC